VIPATASAECASYVAPVGIETASAYLPTCLFFGFLLRRSEDFYRADDRSRWLVPFRFPADALSFLLG
jgi:hypothetical protein